MKVSGFYVTIYCNELPNQKYRVEGNFNFINDDELNNYIIKLKELHEQTFNCGVKIEILDDSNDSKIIDSHDGC